MKICITGAHFTPAQAVIEELKTRKNIEIIYIGRNHTQEGDKSPSVESQVLPRLGVKFLALISGRLQRRFTRYTVPSLLKIPVGFFQAFYYLVKERPDVILSFGGYVGVPVVISGWLLSIPIIVHEQTLVSGLANRISNIFADKIAVSFEKDYDFDRLKIVLTGNPIRKEILDSSNTKLSSELSTFFETAKKTGKPTILITGGNQGSHLINDTVSKSLGDLTKDAFVIHQTGDSKFFDYDNLTREKENLKFKGRYLVYKWIDGSEMGKILKMVDLAVSRAGANTLLELAYFGVPTLIIPIPFIYKDEQTANARFFKDRGLAEILPQGDLTPKSLVTTLQKMIRNLNALKDQAVGAKDLVIPDASKRLAQEAVTLPAVIQ